MDYKNIPEIVARYWEGETTLAEEALLRAYFNSEEVSDEMKSHQSYFQLLGQEKQIKLDTSFDDRLIAKLTTDPIVTKEVIPSAPTPIRSIKPWSSLSRIAAAVLILVSMYFLMRPTSPSMKTPALAMQDTFQTPEEAYEEVRELLSMVSTKLNKGTNRAAKGVLKMQETSNLFKTN